MRLDALTPRGQTFIARQLSIVDVCARAWGADPVHPAGAASPIDALFSRGGRLWRAAEVKARDLSMRALRQHGSYLVTFDKLVTGRALAMQMGVDFALVVGLDDALVWWLIADAAGVWRSDLRIAVTTTQATCNGGDATRANAFLALGDMRVILAAANREPGEDDD